MSGEVHVEWFSQLDLDPDAHPVAMGTRSLGQRPWLITDDKQAEELALKATLLDERHDQVLHTIDAAEPAGAVLADLIGAGTSPTGMSSLEHASRAVQEDLCLLKRRFLGWFLEAGCLCFPTRWHLREKVGQHIADVHGPVDGYDARITSQVDRLFDRLGPNAVWRRNWFLMTDPTLFQPERPTKETIISEDSIHDALFIRSERQTLRRLDTHDGEEWIVFTIRIQQEPLGQLLTNEERTAAFANWVEHVSDDFGRRRHLTPPQRSELLAALRHN